MKKFKKYFALLCAASAAVTLCFAGCGEDQPSGNTNQHTHTFDSTVWENDEEYHWHPATCEHETQKGSRTRHTVTDTPITEATCTEGGLVHRVCPVCGYEADVATAALGHQLEEVAALAPTCEVDGHTAYSVCSRCGITQGYQIIRHTGEHRYSDEWSFNGLTHWHASSCGCGRIADEEEHSYGEDGTCTECGYEKPTDEALEAIYTFEANGDEYTVTGLQEGMEETELTLPATYRDKTVTAIAPYAFEGNTSITEVVIGSWYDSLGEQIFEGCTALQSVTLDMDEITIPDNMFHGCTSLSELVLGGEITWIGRQAFGRCAALKEIEITDACTFIGQNAFRGSGLTAVEVPGSVATIGSYAFAECASLETAVIGSGVRYFFGGWFMDCPALTALTVPFVGSNVSADDSVTAAFGYFFGMEEPAAADSYEAVEQDGTVYYIPKTLESVTVTGGTIGEGAFDGCSMLKTITAETAVDVRADTFEGCTAELKWIGHEVVTPELDITLTLNRTTAYTGRTVRLGIAVTAGAEVSVSVKKGDAAAAETDYNYDETAKTIVFLTSGEYTVTATATLGEETKESSATITIVATPPTLSGVSASATKCLTDEEITLSYTSDAEVTVTVKKGEEAAAEGDYTYTAAEKKLTFRTAGEYTVVFTADREGMTAVRELKITVEWRGPELSAITVSSDVLVMDSDTLTLTFTANEGSTFEYTVKKGDAEAQTPADYTRTDKSFVFHTAGEYTITVKATLHEKTEEKSTTVQVVDPSETSVTLSVDSGSVQEGTVVTVTARALLVSGDGLETDEYKVWVKGSGESYEEASPDSYEWTEGHSKIRFKIAGSYKIEYSVTTQKGGSGTGKATVEVAVAELELSLAKDSAWLLVKSNEEKTIEFTADGYLEAFSVEYKADKELATIRAAEAGNAVIVKYDSLDTVTFTVTYTHKRVAEKVYTLSIPVSFVEDVEGAPRFGADPFGGTAGKLIPSTALQLYFEVNDQSGTALAYSDITFEVVAETNTTGANVTVDKVTNTDYAYVLVENFGVNTASGEFVLKLTATKDGKSAVSTKKFTVSPLGDPNDVRGINDYIDEIYPEMRGAMNLDVIVSGQHRENMVITKEGIFVHRTGADGWDPDQTNKGLLAVTWQGGDASEAFPDNFQLDFDYTIAKRTKDNRKVSFVINMRTGSWNGYCGRGGEQTSFYVENDATKITCGYWGQGQSEWCGEDQKPEAEIGKPIHIRLVHTLADGKVKYTWTWSTDNTQWTQWFAVEMDATTNDASIGSPIHAMQFNNEQGSYFIGNFKLIALGE